jgi:hypothetical protein
MSSHAPFGYGEDTGPPALKRRLPALASGRERKNLRNWLSDYYGFPQRIASAHARRLQTAPEFLQSSTEASWDLSV